MHWKVGYFARKPAGASCYIGLLIRLTAFCPCPGAQGHSIKSVQLNYQVTVPPAVLYHGTASRFTRDIFRQGLTPQGRHHVHLTESTATARQVGIRYGMPVILQINATAMHEAGYPFYQVDNDVLLTDAVAPRFLSKAD